MQSTEVTELTNLLRDIFPGFRRLDFVGVETSTGCRDGVGEKIFVDPNDCVPSRNGKRVGRKFHSFDDHRMGRRWKRRKSSTGA